jgi:hypothetical protein
MRSTSARSLLAAASSPWRSLHSAIHADAETLQVHRHLVGVVDEFSQRRIFLRVDQDRGAAVGILGRIVGWWLVCP